MDCSFLGVDEINRELCRFDALVRSNYFPGFVSNRPVFSVGKNERSRVVSIVMVINVPHTRSVSPDGYGRKDELAKGFFTVLVRLKSIPN